MTLKKNLTFEEYFQKDIIASKGKKKFTLILGSGFHKNAIRESSVLSSWVSLLTSINPNLISGNNYHLDFEINLSEIYGNNQAGKKENLVLSQIANILKSAQKSIIENSADNYPSYIFNPYLVSDIISLNFDTTAENIFKIRYPDYKKEKGFVKIENNSSQKNLRNINIHQTTRFVSYEDKGNKVTFWYPHGSVVKPTSIILGTRKYSSHISSIERLRINSKSDSKKNDTWYDALVHNPVLILGASISSDEWDLWTAILNRERNFGKAKNKRYWCPMFQMRSNQGKIPEGQPSRKFFHSLFNEKLKFKDQWEKLNKYFKIK